MSRCFKLIFAFLIFINSANALEVRDLYEMSPGQAQWYLAGIYEANLVQWNDGGKRSKCISELKFTGFYKLYSEFLSSLSEDPQDSERLTFDPMNPATLAWMILDKECVKSN